jgi:hypothetical protein
MPLNIVDQIIIAVTATFLFVHVKTLMVKPDFLFNGLIGIWIAMSIFDMYARYRKKQQ